MAVGFMCSLLLACSSSDSSVEQAPQTLSGSVLIRNAVIVDGTGRTAYPGALRMLGDTITDVGDLAPRADELIHDAGGQIIAPGFIDTHSHLELIMHEDRHVVPAISQGITTVIVGQDGFSPYPLDEWYESLRAGGIGPNVASYVGHNTLRSAVLQEDAKRPASKNEIDQMRRLLAREMRSGALGLSTGLEYDTGIYSKPNEIIALAHEAKRLGGRYITHIRSEDRDFWNALDEAIDVGRETGIAVQISHIKLSMKGLWGQADKVLERLDAARAEGIDITADIYPYTYWKSTMTVMLPERDLEDRAALKFAFQEIAPPEKIFLTLFEADPSLEGKSIADIATARQEDSVTTYLQLLRQSEALAAERGVIRQEVAGIVAHAMSDTDLATFMRWPHSNICSDGEKGAHPRAYGSYPRMLARYVRNQKVLKLEQAVRKMTSLPALHMGIADRGTLAPGMKADLVVFDPERIQDHATVESISALSTGIDQVWVNGILVFASNEVEKTLPGQIVRENNWGQSKVPE